MSWSGLLDYTQGTVSATCGSVLQNWIRDTQERLSEREAAVEAHKEALSSLDREREKAKGKLSSIRRDRQGTEDALKRWAAHSYGSDESAAVASRLALRGLLQRSISKMELTVSDESGAAFAGVVAVELVTGETLYVHIDDANDEAELQALRNVFVVPDEDRPADWVEAGYVDVPEWWPPLK